MSTAVQQADGRWLVSGGMTLETAPVLLARGLEALASGEPQFDLSAVEAIDSSGLAVLFGWQRAASSQGKSLRIANPPRNLVSLAEVYGVAGLLPLS
ncbi:MAG: STAS domain-containing protein [Pseudomonadota bacterium]